MHDCAASDDDKIYVYIFIIYYYHYYEITSHTFYVKCCYLHPILMRIQLAFAVNNIIIY